METEQDKKWTTKDYVWDYMMWGEDEPRFRVHTIKLMNETKSSMICFLSALYWAYVHKRLTPPNKEPETKLIIGFAEMMYLDENHQKAIQNLSYYKTYFIDLKEIEWDNLSEFVYLALEVFEASREVIIDSIDVNWPKEMKSSKNLSTIEDYENNSDTHGDDIKKLKREVEELKIRLDKLEENARYNLKNNLDVIKSENSVMGQIKILTDEIRKQSEKIDSVIDAQEKATKIDKTLTLEITKETKRHWLW